ncbi:MAG: hypothetical protein IRZ16_03025 [Myxococcaceae bacterium]|nr:hypothetical protein [Myxococcaceae bacterium]
MTLSLPRGARARGQTLLLMALTMLVVVLMACMTLSITTRVRQKLELQTVADTAAYSQAVATARAFNAMGVMNRTIVSHWVALLGIQANVAWGSSVTDYFDAFAYELNKLRYAPYAQCPTRAEERQRQRELRAARDAFLHASFSMWKPPPGRFDDVSVPFCSAGSCFPRVDSGRLDRAVVAEAKDVREAIRDLVEVQRDVYTDLVKALGEQTLAKKIALLAQGKTSGNPFPVAVNLGAGFVPQLGRMDRPVAQREVEGALGTTRADILPLAHAAMGSRGNRFMMSGSRAKGNGFVHVMPRRALIYTARIQRALNRRFGPARGGTVFAFGVTSGLTATYLDNGGMTEDFGDGDIDEVWNAVTDAQADAPGTEEGDVVPPDDDVQPPEFYNAGLVNRITPSRSLGFTYVTSRHNGQAHIYYRSPCREYSLDPYIVSISRARTEMSEPAVSAHEWMIVKDRVASHRQADGSREFTNEGQTVLHGTQATSHGYEVSNHRPGTMCHAWHRHWYEISDDAHQLGKEIQEMGVAPGGFGFVFPGAATNCTSKMSASECKARLDNAGAGGAFGQPKTPILLTRATSGPGVTDDPWNLTVGFRFTGDANGPTFDMKKTANAQPLAALSTGIAYYHRRCDRYQDPQRRNPKRRADCRSWKEAPNLLNPFWRATLVPIDIDESTSTDATPGSRLRNDAAGMLAATGLNDAARTYRLLKKAGYEGIQ